MQNHYDYEAILDYAGKKWKEKYGFEFQTEEENKPVIVRLLAYFLRDEKAAAALQLDLRKGILLTGPIGCGKTSLMNFMNEFSARAFQTVHKSSRDVSIEFAKTGVDVIYKYANNSFFPYSSIPRIYCFDDLGQEPRIPLWGNDFNVMAEILLSRYNLMVSRKMITHVITTLSAAELERLYGNRVRSCLRAMFNLVAYNPGSRDKR